MGGRLKNLPSTIGAGRLVLRRWTIDDAETLNRVIETSREHLRPFMPFASADPNDAEFRRQWIVDINSTFDLGTSFSYGVIESEEIIGGCSVDPKSDDVASIGYWIASDHARRGYATAAARALRDAAFDAGFTTVVLRHDVANHPSAAIARRLGFTLVSTEPHSIDAPGQTGTSLVWECKPG